MTTRYERLSAILERVCERYGCGTEDARGPRIYKSLHEPRRVAMWLMRRFGASFTEIGRFMHRDHASVQRAVRQVDPEAVPMDLVEACAPEALAKGPAGCERCQGLLAELAALKIEVMEMRVRFGGKC